MANLYENLPIQKPNNLATDELSHSEVRKAISGSDENVSEKVSPVREFFRKPHIRLTIYAVCILSVMLLSFGLCLAAAFKMTSEEGCGPDSNNTRSNCHNETLSRNPNETNQENFVSKPYYTFSREDWGGMPPDNDIVPLKHPTQYVLISHTGGMFCRNFTECAPIVRQLQLQHVRALSSPDIGYNFLIGGDGNVYIGRGWDVKNYYGNDNVGISYIGNFVRDRLTTRMISTLETLLSFGVRSLKLSASYKIICQNQTFNTVSPGGNVYEEISKFDHFYPGLVTLH